MFFPPPGVKYEDADFSPIAVDNGEITFYLSNCWVARCHTILKTMTSLNAGSKARKVSSLPFKSNFSAQIRRKRDKKLSQENCL
jgi:hypothetical protein